jgi:hypothetical protein
MNAGTGWRLPWAGGCRCGRLRVEVAAPPLMAWACHCSGCQRMTASAYSLTLTVPAAGFRVTEGEPVTGGLHGPTRHFGCGHCLSWVFTRPEGMDDFVNLRATMLDDHGWFVPFVEVWTREMLPWAATPAAHRFETDPEDDDFPRLIADFAERGARPA